MEDNTEDNHIHLDESSFRWIEQVATAQKRISLKNSTSWPPLWPRDLWKGSVYSKTSDTTEEVRFTAEDALDYAENVESAWEFKALPEDALIRADVLRFLALCRLGPLTVHIKIEDEDSRDWVC